MTAQFLEIRPLRRFAGEEEFGRGGPQRLARFSQLVRS
jgi:hypothetical protein